ncbi:MAG: hypothetical protein KGI25_06315 [Thaumarchaeota archaeon]|nr:hypothetical protein [Nitrososphaerota archaeon]
MTKNVKRYKSENVLVMDIIIDAPYRNKQHIWRLRIIHPATKNDDASLPKDIFHDLMNQYNAILDFIRALAKATKPLRELMKERAKTEEKEEVNEKKLQGSTKQIRDAQKQQFAQSTKQINLIKNATQTFKENMQVDDIYNKIALALVLTDISFEEIEKSIQINGEFKHKAHMSQTPKLSAISNQQVLQYAELAQYGVSIFGTFLGMH